MNQHFDCVFYIYKDGLWLGYDREWKEYELQAWRWQVYEKAKVVCDQYPGAKIVQRFLLPG